MKISKRKETPQLIKWDLAVLGIINKMVNNGSQGSSLG